MHAPMDDFHGWLNDVGASVLKLILCMYVCMCVFESV